MSKSTYFFLNGNKYHTSSMMTIYEIIIYFNYNTSLLVLEHNRLICNKKKWSKIYIENNDILEIVTIVGGG